MPPPAAPTVSRLGLSRSSSATTIDEGGPPKTTLAPPVKKLTPGRRGEKRKRPLKQQMEEDEEKRRRAGKIVSDAAVGAVAAPEISVRSPSGSLNRVAVKGGASIPVAGQSNGGIPEIIAVDDEDIFGNVNRIEDVGANQAVTKPRSATKSECETKNKAVRSVIFRFWTKQLKVSTVHQEALAHVDGGSKLRSKSSRVQGRLLRREQGSVLCLGENQSFATR